MQEPKEVEVWQMICIHMANNALLCPNASNMWYALTIALMVAHAAVGGELKYQNCS